MSKSLKVLTVVNLKGDHSGTHRNTCREIGRELTEFGHVVENYNYEGYEQTFELANLLKERRYDLVHVEQGQLLDLTIDGHNIYEVPDLKVIGQIRDHWFYPWLTPNLLKAPKNCHLIHTDKTFANISSLMPGFHEYGLHTGFSAGTYRNLNSVLKGSPIFVGTCGLKSSELINAIRTLVGAQDDPQLKQFALDSIEYTIANYKIPSWLWDAKVVDSAILAHTARLSLSFFYLIFKLCRDYLRMVFLDKLSELPVDLVIKGGWRPPKKTTKANIKLSPIPFEETRKLLDHAEIVMADNASFFTSIGERVSTSVVNNRLCICPANHHIEDFKNRGYCQSLFCFDNLAEIEDKLYLAKKTDVEKSPTSSTPEELEITFYLDRVIPDTYEWRR